MLAPGNMARIKSSLNGNPGTDTRTMHAARINAAATSQRPSNFAGSNERTSIPAI